MGMSCDRERLRKLVDVFRDFEFDNTGSGTLEEFRSPALVLSRRSWEAVRGDFTISETIVLAQALTVLESEFKWTGGSGAAAIWILKDLLERQPTAGESLADWIAPRTRNGYLRLACDRRAAVRVWVGDLSRQSYGQ